MKTALIVIDGATVEKIADKICAALKGYQTVIRKAESFVGTDLLPAQAFFLGCEIPEPASFAYLDQMLQHINLSGRCCGVFSTDSKALKYLSKMVKDSSVSLGEPLLSKDGEVTPGAMKEWTKKILNESSQS